MMHKFIKFCIINALFMQSDFRRTSVWNFWIRRNGIEFSETDPMATLDVISFAWNDEMLLNNKTTQYFWWNPFKKKYVEIHKSYFMHYQQNNEITFLFITLWFLKSWIIEQINNNTIVKIIKTQLCNFKTWQTNIK